MLMSDEAKPYRTFALKARKLADKAGTDSGRRAPTEVAQNYGRLSDVADQAGEPTALAVPLASAIQAQQR